MSWALLVSERHLSVALGFRAAERNRRVAAAVLAGGFAYRLFFWLLACGLVAGGVLGFLGGESTEDALDTAGASRARSSRRWASSRAIPGRHAGGSSPSGST